MARIANISPEKAAEAVSVLSSPDPDTLTQEHEGRRIERVENGYLLLNWGKYRELAKRAMVQEQNREAQAKWRNRQKATGESAPNGTTPAGAGKERVPPLARVRGTNHPKSLQEVIQAGSMLGMEESACKKFWEHYEGRAKEDENGNSVWITGPEERYVIVGNWHPLLGTWKTNDEERKAKEKAGARTPREAVREPGPAPTPAPIINQ